MTTNDITILQQKLDAMRDEMVRNVSHELRTPAAIIYGYAELLLGDWGSLSDGDKQEFVTYIRRNAANMKWLVNNLLAIYESRSPRAEEKLKPVDFSAVAAEAVAYMEPLAQRSQVAVTSHIEPGIVVRGHRIMLYLMLNNLLANAIKFSPKGRVHVVLRQDGDHVLLSVADTGIGIAPEIIEQIWEPFVQGDGSDTRQFGGSGIGLAVVAQIVNLHHAQIDVQSQVGQGSTFTVTLEQLEEPTHE